MTGKISFQRAYGYYACYVAMVEACGAVFPLCSAEDKGVLWTILSLVLRNAQKTYADMDEKERGSELALGSDYSGFRFSVVVSARDIIERNRRGKVSDDLRSKLRRVKGREADLRQRLKTQEEELGQLRRQIALCEERQASRKARHFGLFGR